MMKVNKQTEIKLRIAELEHERKKFEQSISDDSNMLDAINKELSEAYEEWNSICGLEYED